MIRTVVEYIMYIIFYVIDLHVQFKVSLDLALAHQMFCNELTTYKDSEDKSTQIKY